MNDCSSLLVVLAIGISLMAYVYANEDIARYTFSFNGFVIYSGLFSITILIRIVFPKICFLQDTTLKIFLSIMVLYFNILTLSTLRPVKTFEDFYN